MRSSMRSLFSIGLWLLLGCGLIVRSMKLSLMEFKSDEMYFISQSLLHPFAPAIHSSIAISHPPTFAYFLSMVTAFTTDPLMITTVIVCANLAALWLCYLLCKKMFCS